MRRFDGEAFVRRFMTVWGDHDVAGIAEMFTDDMVYEPSIGPEPWGERAVGREAAGKLAAAFFERMPDVRNEKLRHFVSPEVAVVESRTTGTRAGTPYDVHLVEVLTLRDGKIAAKRSYRKVTCNFALQCEPTPHVGFGVFSSVLGSSRLAGNLPGSGRTASSPAASDRRRNLAHSVTVELSAFGPFRPCAVLGRGVVGGSETTLQIAASGAARQIGSHRSRSRGLHSCWTLRGHQGDGPPYSSLAVS